SVDETGVAPTLKMQAEQVESDLRGGPTLVRDFAMSIENWDTQPRVRTSVACCPNHRIDALILQIEAVGSRGSMAPGWGERPGRRGGDASCGDEPIDPHEDFGHLDVRCGGCGHEIIGKGYAMAVDAADPAHQPNTSAVQHSQIEG